LPYSVHILRCVFRNVLIAAHNLPLILLVFLVCGIWPRLEWLAALPGLALMTVNAFFVALFLGMLCARFRDIGPIVGSAMQLLFFLSPVLWKPELLGPRADWLLLNPAYTLMEVVRGRLAFGAVLHGVRRRRRAGLLRPLPRPHRLLGLGGRHAAYRRRGRDD
jgi:lipopolysaccharide transport system permease protein